MSSDRIEKEKCLAILFDVGQYITQDKRDPLILKPILKQVKSLLQPIIDKSDKEPIDEDCAEKERMIIFNLKLKILSGEIELERCRCLGGYGGVVTREHRHYGDKRLINKYKITRVQPLFHGSRFTLTLRREDESHDIDLVGEDAKFFLAIFEKNNKISKDFLTKFLS